MGYLGYLVPGQSVQVKHGEAKGTCLASQITELQPARAFNPILSRTGFSRIFCCFPIVVVERYTRYLGKLPEVAYEARLGQDPVRSLERPFAPSNPGTFYARAVDGT